MAGPICPACGAPVPSDARYCIRCGARQLPLRPPASWRRPLLAAVLVLVLCAIGFALTYSRLSSDADEGARSVSSVAPAPAAAGPPPQPSTGQ